MILNNTSWMEQLGGETNNNLSSLVQNQFTVLADT